MKVFSLKKGALGSAKHGKDAAHPNLANQTPYLIGGVMKEKRKTYDGCF